MRKLFDFSDFKLKEFPYDKEHSALGEYHYIMPKGYYGGFYDPIQNHQWRSMDGSWLSTEMNGKYYMESNRGDVSKGHFSSITPFLIYEKLDGLLNELSVDMIIQGSKKMSGLTFGYITSRHNYLYVIEDGCLKVIYRNQESFKVLKSIKIEFEALKEYSLKIVKKDNYLFYLNNELMFTIDLNIKGKAGIVSVTSAKFTNLVIDIKNIKEKEDYKLLEAYKKIDLKGFGSGRQMRFGLTDIGPVFVFAKHQKRHCRDSYAHISGLTAFDMEGNVLWQKGNVKDYSDNYLISCDLPMQIADVDNDSNLEFIYCKDFCLHILDLKTGKLKKEFRLPYVKNDELVGDYPFDYLNCDGLRVADFLKKGYKDCFVVKDRYKNVFALDNDGFVLWRYNHKNTGHFPYIYDFDNDGVDEMYVGYDLVKNGNVIWSLPINSDHTDEIIYESLKEGEDKLFILASGNEGFNIVDINGNIVKHNDVGHAQRISLAKYDGIEYQICVTSFWGANNIIYLFDSNGNMLKEKEYKENGCVITPVYDGIKHYILLNSKLGIIDDKFKTAYRFKEKDRPMICSESLDIDNDGIDEILLWDKDKLYVYKFENIYPLKKIKKYDNNAMSNYRGEFSVEID